jgi:inward rectifier potassium channel
MTQQRIDKARETLRFVQRGSGPLKMRAPWQAGRWRDFYHRALTMPGWILFCELTIVYFAANAAFATLYWLDPEGIANSRADHFGDYFFFSVQTMATIGYGLMAPQSTYANILVTLEALLGLTGFALAAALMFARFSRPTARVLFSNVAVIAPFDGAPTLMFRVANQRRNRIQEARVRVDLVRDEISSEGISMRRFYELPLIRARNPVFALSWMVMHRVTPDSPLGTFDENSDTYLELIVTFSGIDESFAQTINARHSFLGEEIRVNHRFRDIVTIEPDGTRSFDYGCFHETERIHDR